MLMMSRIMVFNVLAHNQDDHAKNFAFLMDSTAVSECIATQITANMHSSDIVAVYKHLPTSIILNAGRIYV